MAKKNQNQQVTIARNQFEINMYIRHCIGIGEENKKDANDGENELFLLLRHLGFRSHRKSHSNLYL